MTQKTKLIQILLSEFRSNGYDGLSLAKISKATDLGKASLYHHFPGGKDQMAFEVMQLAVGWVQSEIADVLTSSNLSPKERINLVLKRFDSFYECGEKACILEAMIASDAPKKVKEEAKSAFEILLEGFKKLAMDSEKTSAEALLLAESTIAELQGALIISRGMGNRSIFKRALLRIQQKYS